MMDEQVEIVEEKPDKDKYWKLTRDCLLEGTLYLCVLLMTVFFFLLLKPFTSFYHVGAFAKTFIALVFAGCGVFIAYMGVTKRLKARHIVMILLVAGYALRVGKREGDLPQGSQLGHLHAGCHRTVPELPLQF